MMPEWMHFLAASSNWIRWKPSYCKKQNNLSCFFVFSVSDSERDQEDSHVFSQTRDPAVSKRRPPAARADTAHCRCSSVSTVAPKWAGEMSKTEDLRSWKWNNDDQHDKLQQQSAWVFTEMEILCLNAFKSTICPPGSNNRLHFSSECRRDIFYVTDCNEHRQMFCLSAQEFMLL